MCGSKPGNRSLTRILTLLELIVSSSALEIQMRVDITERLSITEREKIYNVSTAAVQDLLSLIDS